MTILKLHSEPIQSDIVAGLRNLADKIERGAVEDMPVVSTCVVVLGHSSSKTLADDERGHEVWHDLYSWGPRSDPIAVRGFLSTALRQS